PARPGLPMASKPGPPLRPLGRHEMPMSRALSENRLVPRRPSVFRQSDLTKAVKAVVAAGLHLAGGEVSAAGDIVDVTAPEAKQADSGGSVNGWDEGLRHDKSSA